METEERIILKVYGKVPEELKAGIKAIGGYWDDLFDAWNLPGNSFGSVGEILRKLETKHTVKEFTLPKKEKNRSAGRIQTMCNKYYRLLEAIIREENKLAVDVHKYETGRKWIGEDGREELPSSTDKYTVAPQVQGKTPLEYQIEKAFYDRWKSIQDTRKEIDDINRELRLLEIEAH